MDVWFGCDDTFDLKYGTGFVTWTGRTCPFFLFLGRCGERGPGLVSPWAPLTDRAPPPLGPQFPELFNQKCERTALRALPSGTPRLPRPRGCVCEMERRSFPLAALAACSDTPRMSSKKAERKLESSRKREVSLFLPLTFVCCVSFT